MRRPAIPEAEQRSEKPAATLPSFRHEWQRRTRAVPLPQVGLLPGSGLAGKQRADQAARLRKGRNKRKILSLFPDTGLPVSTRCLSTRTHTRRLFWNT